MLKLEGGVEPPQQEILTPPPWTSLRGRPRTSFKGDSHFALPFAFALVLAVSMSWHSLYLSLSLSLNLSLSLSRFVVLGLSLPSASTTRVCLSFLAELSVDLVLARMSPRSRS